MPFLFSLSVFNSNCFAFVVQNPPYIIVYDAKIELEVDVCMCLCYFFPSEEIDAAEYQNSISIFHCKKEGGKKLGRHPKEKESQKLSETTIIRHRHRKCIQKIYRVQKVNCIRRVLHGTHGTEIKVKGNCRRAILSCQANASRNKHKLTLTLTQS